MAQKPRWLSSQILLLVIVGWVSGLAVIHHLWLVPSIKAQVARQESGVAIRWIEQCLNGLAQERRALGRFCQEMADSPPAGIPDPNVSGLGVSARLVNTVSPTSQPDHPLAKLDPIGVVICDGDQRVIATFGWVTVTSLARPKPTWQVGDRLGGGPIFPPASQSARLTGLLAANGRVCLFAREPVGPSPRPRGYLVFVRPIDWPMLQDLAAVTGVTVMLTDAPAPGELPRDAPFERVHHWSSGHGTLSADVNLKDSLGRPVGRLQVSGSVLDLASAAERVRQAYSVQLFWLIAAAFATFAIVYLLFTRPLAILVRRLSDDELPRKRDGLSAGLFAETGILARKFSEVMERIVVLSETDPLTGLLNRRQFQILLEHEFLLSRRHNASLAALMIDIDFFKQVNDRCGHLVGDEVLQMVARAVREVCRKSDVCGRYGGEEFAVILPRTTMAQAALLGERIRDAVNREAAALGQPNAAVTVSVGVAAVPETPCARADDLLNLADRALYAAKHSGRNRTVLARQLDSPDLAASADQESADAPDDLAGRPIPRPG